MIPWRRRIAHFGFRDQVEQGIVRGSGAHISMVVGTALNLRLLSVVTQDVMFHTTNNPRSVVLTMRIKHDSCDSRASHAGNIDEMYTIVGLNSGLQSPGGAPESLRRAFSVEPQLRQDLQGWRHKPNALTVAAQNPFCY